MQDKTLTCRDCNTQFVFTATEQEFFAQKGYTNEPGRCPECRAARKAQSQLVVEERVVSGKQVKRLRHQGIVPANMYGHNLSSVSLQVTGKALHGALDHGGNDVILSLKVGNQPAVQKK